MARQLGVYQYSGKLGETVGSRASAAQKYNSVRRTPRLNNPKSRAQSMQRMRMQPAVNLYRALGNILDHSFQGVKYGGPSHNFFMREALKGDQFPYLEKGNLEPVPGAYLIANGSLRSIVPDLISTAPGVGATFVGIGVTTDKADKASFTMAELTAAITEQLGLTNGDQLTFVNCLADDSVFQATLNWDVRRIVLNANSTDNAPSWITAKNGQIVLAIESIASLGWYTAASAVIVSRPRIRGGKVTWLRSKSVIFVDGVIMGQTRNPNRFEACLESYMNTQAVNTDSDWYLNQGTAEGDENEGAINGNRMLVAGAFADKSNALFMTTNGVSRLVVKEDPDDNTKKFYYTYNAGGNVATMVRPSVAVTSLPSQYVLMSTVQNYFPSLEVEENGAIEETP